MLIDRREVVFMFRGHYGRLCTLMAQAITQGHSVDHVVEASRGKGSQPAPVYVRLRAQRLQMNSALDACRWAGLMRDGIEAAREVKATVEQEWNVNIPMIAERP